MTHPMPPSVAVLFFIAGLLLIGSMSSVPEQKRALMRQIQDGEHEMKTHNLLFKKVFPTSQIADKCPRYHLINVDLLKNLLSFKGADLADLDYRTTRVMISEAMDRMRSELKSCIDNNPLTNL
jgi:hypothetical protein